MLDRILIAGTGALASLFAARLSAAGARVGMLGGWPEGLAALKANGVRLLQPDAAGDTLSRQPPIDFAGAGEASKGQPSTGPAGIEERHDVQVFSDPAECAGADYALVLVKAWQTERTAAQLRACLNPDGLALTLQNGAGNYEQLAAALGPERAALGVTTTGATLMAPGLVRPGGRGVISVQQHPRISPVVELLRAAGFEVEETPNPEGLVWSKLVVNAAINPLTAMLRVPNGDLLSRPDARDLMGRLAREAAAVAAALGVALTFSDPAAAAEDVARKTAGNHSSMLQDVLRGAPTEIDAICGVVVREGQRLGVPTPVNEVMWRLVRAVVNP